MTMIFDELSWSEISDNILKNKTRAKLNFYEPQTEGNEMSAKYSIIGANVLDANVEIDVSAISKILTAIEVKYSGESTNLVELEVIKRGNSDIHTEIQVPLIHRNRARVKLKFYGVLESTVDTEIESRLNELSEIDTQITPRAFDESIKNTEINIVYGGISDIYMEIQPVGHINIPVEIEVRPHNRMWALYEVQQPPIITTVLNPFQDSFTREQSAYQTINYGSSSSMVVGRSDIDIWRSFLQFDLSFINPSYVLTDSYLKLYYRGSAPTTLSFEVLNADSAWHEHSITNLNKPNPIKLITNEFTVDVENGYVEFNVLDVVKQWVSQTVDNNGFILRLANETALGQGTFYTRETSFPPELIVKHYDSRIFSSGRSQVLTLITTFKADKNDVDVELEVTSAFGHSTIFTEIYCHRAEVPLLNDILTEIISTRQKSVTEIIVAIAKDSDILTEIGSRVSLESTIYSQIIVSKPDTHSEIFVKYKSNIDTEITPRVYRENDVDIEISVNRALVYTEINCIKNGSNDIGIEFIVSVPNVQSEIYVKHRKDILTEIEATNDLRKVNLPTEIDVNRPSINIEVEARRNEKIDLYTEINVSRISVKSMIEVKHRSDIWIEIEPIIKSDVETEIIVSYPKVHLELTVTQYSNSETETEIFVRYNNDILSEIEAKMVSQVETIVDVKTVSQIDTEILINKPYIHTSITIPTWVDFDMLTEIQPRVFMVSNCYAMIQVGSIGGAYAFII